MEELTKKQEDDKLEAGREADVEKKQGVSIVDEARAIRDEVLRAKEDLKTEREALQKVQSDNLLSSTAGGLVEAPKVSEAEKKQKGAEEFFKGTALGDTIKKANE